MLYFYLLCTKTKDKYKYKAISIKIHTNHKYIKRKDAEPQSFLFYEHGNHETNGTFRFLRAFRVLIILCVLFIIIFHPKYLAIPK